MAVVVLDDLSRGRRANLAWARGQRRRARGRGRHPRPRARRAADCSGVDVVFHQAALRITRCAEEPRLAVDVLVGGTQNVLEAAVRGRRAQGRGRLVGLRVRHGRALSDARGPPPVQQRHALRRGQGVRRGPAAQLPRDVRPRLRRAALLQRLRAADGRPRRLHRGARALDGAHRGRAAAADPGRRAPDDGLRPRRRRRPREPPRRGVRRDRRGLQRRQRHGDEPRRELARALLDAMGADLPVEHGPARAVNNVARRLADTTRARERLGFRGARSTLRGRAARPRGVVARRAAEEVAVAWT